MTRPCFTLIGLMVLALAVTSTACKPSSNLSTEVEAEVIRATERARLNALVSANIELARSLHADDFQLINPVGESLSKEQYLGAVASGDSNKVRLQRAFHHEIALLI